MEDEAAEIELLEQNLNKTRQISQRMTSILTTFDGRLAKLEKSILPLYTSTQILNKRGNNIEKALLKIDEVASNQEGIASEEALILRGPQPGQLDAYKDALDRLNASIAFKSYERDSREVARLLETGTRKLTQMYTKLVAEGSSGSTPAPGSELIVTPLPAALLSSLRPLVAFLRTLPLPSTHPSHPAATAILSTLKEAQRGYADMRGTWSRKCLEAQGKRIIDRADTLDAVTSGRDFGQWVETLLTVAEEEYNFLTELSPLPVSSVLASTYNNLLNPLIVLLSETVASLISLIKRSLHKYTFLALASYDSLSALQQRWDVLLARRTGAGADGGRKEKESNELKDGLHSLRAVCLRSFPEFLADVKIAATGKGGELSTGLADFTLLTVNYLGRIPEVKTAVGSALVTLGDGNWKMGEGIQVGKGSKLGETDEQTVTEHFIYDVVATVVNSLTALSRTGKRPAFGAIFMLNNVSYLRNHVLLRPTNPALLNLLSKPTQDLLNSNFRTTKSAYFDANFSPLMQALTDAQVVGAKGKAATKEKFTRFFDLLEEVTERHRMARVLEDDEDGRETIKEEVVKLIVPSLQKFTQKGKEKEFSKNPQKYIKMSSDEVEAQIKSFYR